MGDQKSHYIQLAWTNQMTHYVFTYRLSVYTDVFHLSNNKKLQT